MVIRTRQIKRSDGMNTTLTINREELITINTALMMYNKDIRDITNYEEQIKYRDQISIVRYKVDKAFRRLDKKEVKAWT